MPTEPQRPEDRDLDALLDRALHAYSQVEPPPGAADRWLARHRFNVPEPRLGWRPVLFAFATGIIVAGVVVLTGYARGSRAIAPTARLAVSTARAPARIRSASARPVITMAATKAVAKAVTPAASDTQVLPFPLPSPATDQEKLVVRLLQGGGRGYVIIAQSPPPMLAPVDNQPILNAPLMAPGTAVKAKATTEDGNNNEL